MESNKNIKINKPNMDYIHVKAGSKIDLTHIKVGSYLDIESISSIGNDLKEIRNNLRCMYSKKISFKIKTTYLDFASKNASYRFTIEVLNHLIKEQSENVKKGINKARASGKQIGRKKITINSLPDVFKDNYYMYEKGLVNKNEFSYICKCSRPTLNKWIKCLEESNEECRKK